MGGPGPDQSRHSGCQSGAARQGTGPRDRRRPPLDRAGVYGSVRLAALSQAAHAQRCPLLRRADRRGQDRVGQGAGRVPVWRRGRVLAF